MKKHKHHIIPRHIGGTDDPSNLIELTIENHAEAHLKLYEQYGRIGDKVAWQMLSGRTVSEEDRILLAKEGYLKFLNDSVRVEQWKQSISLARKNQIITETHKKNIASSMTKHWREVGRPKPTKETRMKNRNAYIRNEMGEMLAEGRRNSSVWKESVTSLESREKRRNNSPKSIKIVIDGVEYASIRQASEKTNLSYETVRRMALNENRRTDT